MSWKPQRMTVGDKKTRQFQILQDGAVVDITNLRFRYAVKDDITDTTPVIGEIDGVITDAANGIFTITVDSTHTTITPFRGKEELILYDLLNEKHTLTPEGGVPFELIGVIANVP